MGNLCLRVTLGSAITFSCLAVAWSQESGRSWPKDTNQYSRPAIAADTAVAARKAPTGGAGSSSNLIRVIDAVVNNTDASLQNADTFNDGETSIAINPFNHREIVISAFSGGWGTNAPIWHSTNGGQTWTKRFTVPIPPGAATGCPCDQAFDFGRNNVLYGVFLDTDIFTGSTTNPASSASWAWWVIGGTAQKTNLASTNVDQPWILQNRGTGSGTNENVFSAYDDFSVSPRGMRVVTSVNNVPPQFPAGSDKLVGTGPTGGINPGHRLAKDPRNGWIYSLFQQCSGASCSSDPKTVTFMLNRSTDNGVTWTLNSSSTGIAITTTTSTQPTPKFGTVNALLGGVDHAAVDPHNGDVYYVYGNRDASGNNRLAIRRLFDNGSGGLTIGGEHFVVSGTVQAALPSVAVTEDGIVGVFYYTSDGIVSGFPQFTAWLAISTDRGTTFNSQVLLTFLSPATDNADARQRVLGDYVQMKALGECFFGSFTGNGAAFGRSTSNNDPIFFKSCVPEGHANRDYNGDNRADILWRHNDGTVAIWLMNGASVAGTGILGTVPGSWRIVGTRDFDGDGKADLLWRQDNGDLAIWFLNGTSVVSTAGVGSVPNVWQVLATADFNGDGKADILWRNTSTGEVVIWLMNGATVAGTGSLGAISFDWVPEKAADINGDGKADIQWRNRATGDVAIWLMNGTSVAGNLSLGSVSLAWRIVRLCDVNGDGTQDLLWRHGDGTVAIWLMGPSGVTGTGSLGVVPTDWRIVGCGDFNGDGKLDLLWRNIASLPNWQLAVWFMNGTSVSGSSSLGSVDAAWSTD
jgi:sRNA-binding regulator protein Hfq